MSDEYRRRLARMAGGGGETKPSASSLNHTTRSSRIEAKSTRTASGSVSNQSLTRIPPPSSTTRSNINISSQGQSDLPLEYKQMRSDMNIASAAVVSTRSDAAALQNDLAQRFNLSNAIRPTQRVMTYLYYSVVNVCMMKCFVFNLIHA